MVLQAEDAKDVKKIITLQSAINFHGGGALFLCLEKLGHLRFLLPSTLTLCMCRPHKSQPLLDQPVPAQGKPATLHGRQERIMS